MAGDFHEGRGDMYKVIASDMDETFLARNHSIPKANMRALEHMRELGVAFVPSSGRPYSSVMRSITPEMRELVEGGFILSLNGACLNRVGVDEPLTSHAMDFALIDELFEIGLGYDVYIQVYEMSGRTWGWGQDPVNAAEMSRLMDFDVLAQPDISAFADVPLGKILFDRSDLPLLHRIADEIAAAHPELISQVEITYSSGRFLEFCPKGVDKALGLADLCSAMGVEMSQVIAMGDSLNDLPMIEAAGLGVAVANATDGVDERADYVTKATCDDGALLEVVERFIG